MLFLLIVGIKMYETDASVGPRGVTAFILFHKGGQSVKGAERDCTRVEW